GGSGGAAGTAGGSAGVAGTGGLADGGIDVIGQETSTACGCSEGAHNDRIFVLSQDGELWSYDPVGNDFAMVAKLPCPSSGSLYSMAVDAHGRAWVLYVDSHDLFTVDVNAPATCDDPGYVPDQLGFGLFG